VHLPALPERALESWIADLAADAERDVRSLGQIDLSTQYRSGRSAEYVEWVERLLGLSPGGPEKWSGDERLEVRTAPSPSAIEAALAEKLAEHENARMAAGYC
jgi:hypothetical protein